MIHAVASAWALFLGIAFIMLGNGLQGSLLGIRASLENFPTATTGVVMSGYFAGFLLGSTLVPRMVERVGHVRVFAALASLASTAVLVHAVFVEPVTWFAMRLLTGFSYAGLYVVAESWLNDKATNETRGQLLSIYMVVVLAGAAIGQVLLNLAPPEGFELFILSSVLISLALVPVLLTVSPAPEFAAPTRVSLRQLYQASPLGVVGTFGTGMGMGALLGMGAVYARDSGLSVAGVSLFMGLAFAGGMVLQFPIGRLSDRYDRRLVLTMVTFAAAAVAVAGLAFGHSLPILLVVITLFGGTCLPMYSLCVAHTNDHLTQDQMVAASAGLYLAAGLGSLLGPLVSSWLMALAGPPGFFIFLAAAHGAVGVFALYRMTQRRSLPLDQQDDLADFPSTASPYAATLAPEALRDQMDRDLAEMSRARMMRR